MTIKLTPLSLPAGGYIDIVAAGDLVYQVADTTAWANADDVTKAAALVQASNEIDTLKYMGSRLEVNQDRAFPRFVTDTPSAWPEDKKYASGYYIDSDDDGNPIVPVAVKLATFLQALSILRDKNRVARLRDMYDGITSQSAAGFSEAYDAGKPANIVCMDAMLQLKKYLLKTGNVF